MYVSTEFTPENYNHVYVHAMNVFLSLSEFAPSSRSRGMLTDWTLILYGSEMTRDDIQERKRCTLVVLALKNIIAEAFHGLFTVEPP